MKVTKAKRCIHCDGTGIDPAKRVARRVNRRDEQRERFADVRWEECEPIPFDGGARTLTHTGTVTWPVLSYDRKRICSVYAPCVKFSDGEMMLTEEGHRRIVEAGLPPVEVVA